MESALHTIWNKFGTFVKVAIKIGRSFSNHSSFTRSQRARIETFALQTSPIRQGTWGVTLCLEPGVYVSTGRCEIHGEEHSRERDQLDVALPVLAQDSCVVVQPQPFVLDMELEISFDDLQVDRNGDTMIKVSACTSDLELGKEGKLSIKTDTEGLFGDVNGDYDLPNRL